MRGITAVDAAMLATVTLAGPVLIWPLILAMAASAARLTYTVRALHPVGQAEACLRQDGPGQCRLRSASAGCAPSGPATRRSMARASAWILGRGSLVAAARAWP